MNFRSNKGAFAPTHDRTAGGRFPAPGRPPPDRRGGSAGVDTRKINGISETDRPRKGVAPFLSPQPRSLILYFLREAAFI